MSRRGRAVRGHPAEHGGDLGRRQLADGDLERGGHHRAPVSCANVAIDLSTDGGDTFRPTSWPRRPTTATQAVTIPNTPTTQARIRVSCVGNIFFDISNANFTIT